MGIRVVDSSVGGLGGCPYAKNATGNVATEKVLQFLQSQGMYTVSVIYNICVRLHSSPLSNMLTQCWGRNYFR